jgi:hypothetical protein
MGALVNAATFMEAQTFKTSSEVILKDINKMSSNCQANFEG